MIKPEQAGEFLANIEQAEDTHIAEMKNLDWSDWARIPQSKFLLELLLIQRMRIMIIMMEDTPKPGQELQTIAFYKGESQALSNVIDIISDLRSEAEEKK